MSLPIRYLPMASYFQLSIIFLTPQILQHLLRWHDLFRLSHKPSRDHHQLYPIPIAPLVRYHVGDLPYDLQTTLLHFPFLVSSLLPNASLHSLTDHRSSHHAIGTLPYVSPHTNLVLILLIVCIYSHFQLPAESHWNVSWALHISVTRHWNATGHKFESWWWHLIKIISPDEDVA